MIIETPISLGEVVDKITILEIKSDNINDPRKLANISNELNLLNKRLGDSLTAQQIADLETSKANLKSINQQLWTIEDDIRDCERQSDFTKQFVELARSVYFTNDKRAGLKKQINIQFGSELVEEKSYQAY